MSMNPVQDFFDVRASHWDDMANDDLEFVGELLKRAGIGKGQKVLDLACGTGVITGLLHEMTGKEVVGLDLSGKMIFIAKAKYAGEEGVRFLQGDFLEGQYGRFDAIVLYNAYPHFVEPKKLAEAFNKHLNEGGIFIIMHSFGRERLKKHHEGLSSQISRDIDDPETEGRFFKDAFDIYLAEESEKHYLLCGKRHLF